MHCLRDRPCNRQLAATANTFLTTNIVLTPRDMLSLLQTPGFGGLTLRASCDVTTTDRAMPCRKPGNVNMSPRIVDDLIPVVLESDDHWWPRDLSRLALVSPAWVGPIRRRLYACPKLDSFHACTLFARTMFANPQLQALIRGIDLRPTLTQSVILTEADMTSVRFVLNLRGLQTVTLGGELAVRAERFIQMMGHTHSITSLHIDGSYVSQDNGDMACRCAASLDWDDSIAFRFARSLRTLRLTHLHLDVTPSDMPSPLRVQKLILEDVSMESGSIEDLSFGSWASLRHLSISSSSPQSVQDLALPLLECCEQLESLNYEACGVAADGELFEQDLPALSTIRDLRLFDVDINLQTLSFIARACCALVQLSVLGRAPQLNGQDWIELLQSGVLPSLCVLQTSSGHNQPPSGFRRWSEETCCQLKSACAARNISLLCV